MSEYALGIDIGTGSCHLALIGLEDLALVTLHTCEWAPAQVPGVPGGQEFDADELWELVCSATRRLLAGAAIRADSIAGVCCTSFGGGLIALNSSNAPVWTCSNGDSRARSEAQTLVASNEVDWIYRVSGDGLALSAIPRLRWLTSHEPERRQATVRLGSVADWINQRLSGSFVTDASLAATVGLLDVARRTWAAELANAAGIEVGMLPELASAGTAIGTVSEEAASGTGLRAGTPVILGGWDTAIAQLAVGIPARSQLAVVAGTFWKHGIVLDRHITDPSGRLRTVCHVLDDRWIMEGIGFYSGAAMRWFRDGFCADEVEVARRSRRDAYELMEEIARPVPAGANGVIALLSNVMDSRDWRHATAGFLQFDITAPASSGKRECVRAIEEAAAYVVKSHRLLLETADGREFDEVLFTGGAARANLWPQVLADVVQLRVKAATMPDASALGAARLAAAGTTERSVESITTGDSGVVQREYAPDPNVASLYGDLHAQWVAVYEQFLAATAASGIRPLWSPI